MFQERGKRERKRKTDRERKRERERGGEREGGRAAKCATFRARARTCVYVPANRDPSSNGARPMTARDCAPASARHIVIAGCGPVGAASGGEEVESAVRATRLSASLVRRSSLSDSVVFSRRSLSLVGPLTSSRPPCNALSDSRRRRVPSVDWPTTFFRGRRAHLQFFFRIFSRICILLKEELCGDINTNSLNFLVEGSKKANKIYSRYLSKLTIRMTYHFILIARFVDRAAL